MVVKVIDGDTLKISHEGSNVNVRLIGINAPENNTTIGKEATNYTKTLVRPGDRIRIEFDIQQRDKYGRLLGYVYLPGGKMLNEEIVKSGFANSMTIPPNVKHSNLFFKSYKEAKRNNKGLWGKR